MVAKTKIIGVFLLVLHGDTLATTDATGALVATHTYDPFGNKTGTTLPSNTATNSAYAYLGQHQKETETTFTLTPIQMGARVYLPTLGRFLQPDPIEGGTLNNYVYALDPVNQWDLEGRSLWGDAAKNMFDFAKGIYDGAKPIVEDFVIQPAWQVISPNSSLAERAWGVMALTPVGKGEGFLFRTGKLLYESKWFGRFSPLFGAKRLGAYREGVPKSGILNNNNFLRLGWGQAPLGEKAFRLVFGPTSWDKRPHVDIFKGRY